MTSDCRTVLIKAAELVQDGWCQNRLYVRDSSGSICARCLVSAITDAASALRVPAPVFKQAADAVFALLPEDKKTTNVWARISNWSDSEGRTQSEVIALLESIASPGELN